MNPTDVGKEWTEAELEALPEDGFIHEVVNGELVMSPKNNWYHGRINLFKDWDWD